MRALTIAVVAGGAISGYSRATAAGPPRARGDSVLGDERIVRRNAGLSRVERLMTMMRSAACADRSPARQSRRLSAKLERHWCEIRPQRSRAADDVDRVNNR